MKKTLFFTLLLFAFYAANGQEDEPIQTIFDGKIHKVSGFGGPFMSFTTFNGKFAHMMGGGGAVLLNNQLFFGGYGYGMTTPIKSEIIENIDGTEITREGDLNFGNGGFWLGVILKPQSAIHTAAHLQMGWGDVSFNDDFNFDTDNDEVFILTPAIELDMNMTRFFRISAGVNYRMVLGANHWDTFDNMDFSGPGVSLSFKFGWF